MAAQPDPSPRGLLSAPLKLWRTLRALCDATLCRRFLAPYGLALAVLAITGSVWLYTLSQRSAELGADTYPLHAPQTWAILISGLFLAVTTGTLARLQLTRAEHVEQLVAQRGRELEHEVQSRATVTRQLIRSQEMLAAAQAVAHVGSWDWNIETNDVSWSDELYKILGLRPDQLTGLSDVIAIVHPDDREQVESAIANALKNEDFPEFDHRIVRPDGSVRWVRQVAQITRNNDGQAVSILGTIDDITPSREAELQLRQSEAQLRAVLDSTRMGISLVGRSREVIYRNRAFAEILGYTQEELGDRPFRELSTRESVASGTSGFEALERDEAKTADGRLRAIHKDGHLLDIDAHLVPVELDGSPLGYVMDMRDITEERATQRAIAASESRFRGIFESSTTGMVLLGPDRALGTVNPAFCEIIGFNYASLDDGQADESLERALPSELANYFRGRSHGEADEGDLQLTITRQSDGERRHLRITSRPYVVNGTEHGSIAQFSDITALRESRNALEQGRERLEQAQRIAHVGHWEWDVLTNEVDWSDEIYRIFGLQPREFDPTYPAFLERVHPDDRQTVHAAVARAVVGDQEYEVDHRIVRPDGSIRMVHESGVVTWSEDDQPLRMLGVIHDITEQAEAERALNESNVYLNTVVNTMSGALLITDRDENIILANRAAEEMLGYPMDELTRLQPIAFVHPDERKWLLDRNRSRQQGKPLDDTYRRRLVRKDGSSLWVEASPSTLWLDGKSAGRVSEYRDISAQVEAEDQLRDNNDYLRTVVDTVQAALIISDPEENIVIANQAAADLLGYTLEELKHVKPRAFIHPDDAEAIAERGRARAQGIESEANFRRRMVRKDGTFVWVEASPSTLWIDGKRAGRVAEYRDITHRLEAEAQLQEAAVRLELAQSMAHVGGWRHHESDQQQYWSDEFYRLLGYEPAAVTPSRPLYRDHIHPDDLESYLADSRDYREGMTDTWDRQTRFIGADGVERVLLIHAERTRDAHGNSLYEDGTAQDITQLVRAQTALADSNGQLQLAQAMAHVGSWGRSAQSDDGYWSDEMYRLLGREPSSELPSRWIYREHVHPDDRERLDRELSDFRKEVSDTYDIQARFIGSDGVQRVLQMHGERTRDQDGAPLRLHGTAQDITAQLEAEQQLEHAQQRLQENNDYLHTVFDTVQASLLITDPGDRVVLANSAAEEMLGYSMEELKHIVPGNLVHPDDVAAASQRWQDRLNGVAVEDAFRLRLVRKDGSSLWVDTTSAPMKADGTLADGRVAEYRDVTAQVEAEQQLESARQRLTEELERAGEVQRAFQPGTSARFQMLSVAGQCLPAREVGGDFFDWAPFDNGGVRVTIGDVMGKGIPAAIFMSMTQTAIRAGARPDAHSGSGPAGQLARVNRALFPYLDNAGSFVTAFTAEVDRDGRIAYADAGHGYAAIRHTDGSFTDLRSAGLPIGVAPSTTYISSTARLEPGDSLLLMTDGLRDLLDEASNEAGWTALLDSEIGDWANARQAANEIVSLAQAHASEDGPDDDLTVLVLGYDGAAARNSSSDSTGDLELIVPPRLNALATAESDLQLFLRQLHVGEQRSGQLLTAVHEVLANIVEHARPSSDVTVCIEISEDTILVTTRDDGRPFDSHEAKRAAQAATDRGRGLAMCQILLDRTDHSRANGLNQWQLELKLSPPSTVAAP